MDYFNVSRPNHGNSTNEELDRFARYFLPIVMVVPPLGIPTNWLVIHLLLAKPGVMATPEIFTLQLACFDMLFCFLLVIEYICFVYSKTVQNSYFLAWGLNETGGSLLLCLLSLDSYIGVCHPLLFQYLKDSRVRLSVCILVCILTGGSCWMQKVAEPRKRNTVIGVLFIDIVVISTCTFKILQSLRKSGPSRKEVHPVKRRAFKIVLTSYVLLNLHYIPSLIEHQLRQYGPEYLQSFSPVSTVTYGFLSLASFTQPLSYLVRNKKLPKNRCHLAAKAPNNGWEQSGDPRQ